MSWARRWSVANVAGWVWSSLNPHPLKTEGAAPNCRLHRGGCRETKVLAVVTAAAGEFADDVADEIFGVAEEHQSFVEIVERVVDAGETGSHAALDDHDGARFVDVENGHAVDGAGGVGARGGICDVVGADDESDVGLREIAVDLVHLEEFVVGDVGFG